MSHDKDTFKVLKLPSVNPFCEGWGGGWGGETPKLCQKVIFSPTTCSNASLTTLHRFKVKWGEEGSYRTTLYKYRTEFQNKTQNEF